MSADAENPVKANPTAKIMRIISVSKIDVAWTCYDFFFHAENDSVYMITMQNMNDALQSMDVKILRFMQSLLQTKNVTRTAEVLGISQPSASRILARVRDLTGDPILVRSSGRFQLTDHALGLQQPLVEAMHAIEQVFRREDFDPATSTHCYRIACTDYAVACFIAPLIAQIETYAPNIQFDISPLVPKSFDLLAENEIDIIICAEMEVPSDIIRQKITDEHYALLMRSGHPLAKTRKDFLLPKDIRAYRQIEFKYPTLINLEHDKVMRPAQEMSNAVLLTPFFSTMPYLVAMTDTVAAVPHRLGAILEQQFQLRSVRFNPTQKFGYFFLWHKRSQYNPTVEWLSQEMKKMMGKPLTLVNS